MKIFLGFLALVSCAVHHVTSFGEVESWRTNPIYLDQNHNIRNPLLFGSSPSLIVHENLHNIRSKLEEIEKKNTDLISAVRGSENQYQAMNSFVDDLSPTNDGKEQANAFEIRHYPILEKVPMMPSALNGYFLMFRLKQNISNSVPTKSQSRFIGNEQQHFIQQISTQKPESAVSEQQPFTIQRQPINQQQPLSNQQMHVRRLNIQDQSSNHGSHLSEQQNLMAEQQLANSREQHLSEQQNLMAQQQLANNRGHHLSEQQRSINQQQHAIGKSSPINSQHFSSNERSKLNGHQNQLRPASSEKASINQRHSSRNHQQTIQQQPTTNTQQANGHQGILTFSHEATINQYMRPQDIIGRTANNLPITENPSQLAKNFELPSGQQIQAFADELLKKIQTQALNGESQPAFTDNISMQTQSRTTSADATNHQTSSSADTEKTSEVPPLTTTTSESHETRLPSGASVKLHLKTPYANYDFNHLL